MRTSRKLSLYIARQILQYCLLALLTLSVVLVSQNALRLLDELVVVGVTPRDLWAVLLCMVAMLAAYTLPLAFLFGVFFAVSRLRAEGEITAMQASGLGPSALLVPALAMGTLFSVATGSVMIGVEHRAHRQLRTIVETLAARGGLLEAGRFREIDGRVFYVRERDRENHLRGVMVSDSSNPDRPFVIFAEKGLVEFDEDLALFRIGLENGAIHISPPARGAPGGNASASSGRARQISFDHLDYALDVRKLMRSLELAKRPRQMSFEELDAVVARARAGGQLVSLDQKNPVEYELEIQRRFALPIAPLLFAALAVPLGLGRLGGTPTRGVLIGLVLAMGYYGLFSEFRLLARGGWIAPAIALWVPNLVFALLAILLSLRARRVTG